MPSDTETRSYFQKWYDQRRDAFNKKRRERYADDEEYRDKVNTWNQETREKRRKEAQREESEAKRAVKLKSSGSWKTIEVEVDGVVVPMYTISALAKAVGKGISTIRVWERNGTLPETPYRSDRGDRLYTLEMIENLQRALQKAGKLDIAVLKEKKRPAYVERFVKFKLLDEPVKMRLYKVGTLAKALDRTVIAVVQMEKRGVLPRTPLVASSLEYRLYTLDMIEVVQKMLSRYGGSIRAKADWNDFRDDVLDGWTKLGIMEARVVE